MPGDEQKSTNRTENHARSAIIYSTMSLQTMYLTNGDGGYLYYPFLHSTVYCVLATHNYNISQWWNAGMGNTDTLHPNSCFCSFSIPTHLKYFRIKFLLLVLYCIRDCSSDLYVGMRVVEMF